MTSSKHITDTDTYVSYTLVTDTRTYEIVRRTAKSIWVRPTKDSDAPAIQDTMVDHGPQLPPVVWTPQVSDPTAPVTRLGLRKDGTYRMFGTSILRPAAVFEGSPCRRTDYRF